MRKLSACAALVTGLLVVAIGSRSEVQGQDQNNSTRQTKRERASRKRYLGIQIVTNPDQLNQQVLGATESDTLETARDRLIEIATDQINDFDRIVNLDDRQRDKLQLAAQGDIKQLFDQLETCRHTLETRVKKDGAPKKNVLFSEDPFFVETYRIRTKFRNGPSGQNSLLVKTISSILTDSQREMLQVHRKRLVESKTKINLQNVGQLENIDRLPGNPFRLGWNTKTDELCTLEFGSQIQVRSRDATKVLKTIGEGRQIVAFEFNPVIDQIAMGTNSTMAVLLNLTNGIEKELNTETLQPKVSFSPDGKILATGGYGTKVRLWSPASGELLKVLQLTPPNGGEPVEGGLTMTFSPDGRILAVGNRNSFTQLFDVESGKFVKQLDSPFTHELKFDLSGKRLAIAYVNGDLAIWDVISGAKLAKEPTSTHDLYSLDWSPDGSLIATAGLAGEVELWDARDLTLLRAIKCPEAIHQVRFNPDGTQLIFSEGNSFAPENCGLSIWAVP